MLDLDFSIPLDLQVLSGDRKYISCEVVEMEIQHEDLPNWKSWFLKSIRF